jgi:hypothetical protein
VAVLCLWLQLYSKKYQTVMDDMNRTRGDPGDQETIAFVAEACGCDEDQAIKLLTVQSPTHHTELNCY